MNTRKMLAGTVFSILGLIGAIWGGSTISSDIDDYNYSIWGGYNYKSPLTSHESFTIFIVVFSAVLIIVGICFICASFKSDASESAGSKSDDQEHGDQNPVSREDDDLEQLKRYKELLDNDIITREEFEALKEKVLNR